LTPCSATRLHKVGYVQRGDKFSVWAFRHLVPWSLLCAKMSIPMVDIRCPTSQGEVQESLLEMEEVGQAMAHPSWCRRWRVLPRSLDFSTRRSSSTSHGASFLVKSIDNYKLLFDVVRCLHDPGRVSCAPGCRVLTLEHSVVFCFCCVTLWCVLLWCVALCNLWMVVGLS
jgi:hypothetical protein